MVDGRCSRQLDPDRARTQPAFRAVASCRCHEVASAQFSTTSATKEADVQVCHGQGQPRRSPGCITEQDLQVGKGSGSLERLHWTSGRLSRRGHTPRTQRSPQQFVEEGRPIPTDDVCEALEFELTQGDSSRFDAPLPLPPPVLSPPSVLYTQADSDKDVQATVLDRPSSPPPTVFQDYQYDPAMGAKFGLTVPESDSSSTMSLAADGGSVAGSAAGFGVDVQGVQEVPQVRARAVAVGMASLDSLDLHEIFRQRAIVMRTVVLFEGRFHSRTLLHLRNALPPGSTGTRHGKSKRGSCSS